MPAPSLPDLAFNSITLTGGTTAALWIAMLAATGIVADDSATIALASRHVFTSPAADVCLAVPAATSPVAGKYVLIWGWGATAPAAAAMLGNDLTLANALFFGIYMADAGLTVSAADLTAVWTTNSALSGFNGTTGTFSGFSRVYSGTVPSKAIVFTSAEYLTVQLVDTSGNIYVSGGGMGIRSTTVLDGESGMDGRKFDICAAGTLAMVATHLTSSGQSAGAPLRHGVNNNTNHHYYRIPGQNADSSALTMRGCSWAAAGATAPVGFPISSPLFCVDANGSVEPEAIAVRDVGVGGRINLKQGRHRAFFFGPPRKSRAILSAAGVKKWISFGQSETVDNDSYLMPYG